MPPAVDLRTQCPPVYDQGQLGSCTANGIAGAIEFDRKKQDLPDFVPSRLFIYYNERVMEGTVAQDAGAQIRDGIKSVAKLGAPPETDWPYDIEKFAQAAGQSLHRREAGPGSFSTSASCRTCSRCRAVSLPAFRSYSASRSIRASNPRP